MGYQTNSTFSMFFSSENDGVFDEHNQNQNFDPYYNNNNNYNNLSSSSSSSVDCTLSLATPSSRHLSDETNDNGTWNFFQSKTTSFKKSSGDVNVGRRCASCDTTSTPLWRNGPRGPKSLCNACGIRFKKEERRATARNSTVSGGASSAAGIPAAEYPYNGGGNYYNHHRVNYFSPAPENEYPYVDDVRYEDSDVTTASFLSWN